MATPEPSSLVANRDRSERFLSALEAMCDEEARAALCELCGVGRKVRSPSFPCSSYARIVLADGAADDEPDNAILVYDRWRTASSSLAMAETALCPSTHTAYSLRSGTSFRRQKDKRSRRSCTNK